MGKGLPPTEKKKNQSPFPPVVLREMIYCDKWWETRFNARGWSSILLRFRPPVTWRKWDGPPVRLTISSKRREERKRWKNVNHRRPGEAASLDNRVECLSVWGPSRFINQIGLAHTSILGKWSKWSSKMALFYFIFCVHPIGFPPLNGTLLNRLVAKKMFGFILFFPVLLRFDPFCCPPISQFPTGLKKKATRTFCWED